MVGVKQNHLAQRTQAPNPASPSRAMLATLHIRAQKRQFSPSNFADAIRLFPPSSQGLASARKGLVVSITTTFHLFPGAIHLFPERPVFTCSTTR